MVSPFNNFKGLGTIQPTSYLVNFENDPDIVVVRA